MMDQQPIRLLVVDDVLAVRRALRTPLIEFGFQIAEASCGEDALQLARLGNFDAIILDVNMPGIGGVETLRRLRELSPKLPILMLSDSNEAEEKIVALENGADDYVTKQSSEWELIARIQRAVRGALAPAHTERAAITIGEETAITIGEIQIDPSNRLVTRRNRPVHLSPKEFDVLFILMTHAGRIVPHTELLTAVWGTDHREQVVYLRTYISQLRRKIEDNPSNPIYLLIAKSFGYRFADAKLFAESSLREDANPGLSAIAEKGESLP